MTRWEDFERDGVVYDLSHLDAHKFTFTRTATERHPAKNYTIFVCFADHCFTKHYADKEDWLYLHGSSRADRYFCVTRYHLSKHLPSLIVDLLHSNPLLLLTFQQHREQFFYLEQDFHGETYRVFLEISAPTASYTDIRIDVRSAYDEQHWANPVEGSGYHHLWRIIDARLNGIKLSKKRRR